MRANRYVSYLATEIEPKALTTLSQFERSTERVFERIDAFKDRGAARLGIGTVAGTDSRSRAALTQTRRELGEVRAAAATITPAMRAAAAGTNAMSTSMLRASQALNVVQGPMGPLAGRLSALSTIFRDLAGISLVSVLGGGTAFLLGGIASSYQSVTDRLRPFYETQTQTNAAMKDVIQIARDTRQALDPVAQLYTRLAQAGKDAGVAVDTAAFTSSVAKAARLSGGDADTQKNGLTQFAQGFGSGSLSGDELKSIRENTFRLAKALADGLGVPIAELKKLGSEGKLTPQVVAAAMARSADSIDLEFSRLPKRIGASMTEAGNAVSIFLGRADEATHATQGFAEAISALGNNIPLVVTGLSGILAQFATRNLAAPLTAAVNATENFGRRRLGIGGATADQVRAKRSLSLATRDANAKSVALDAARNEVAANERVVASYQLRREAILSGDVQREASIVTARAAASAEIAAIRASTAPYAVQQAAIRDVIAALDAKAVAIRAADPVIGASPLVQAAEREVAAQNSVIAAIERKRAAMLADQTPLAGGAVRTVAPPVARQAINTAALDATSRAGAVSAIDAQIAKLREKVAAERVAVETAQSAAVATRAAAQIDVGSARDRAIAAQAAVDIIKIANGEATAAEAAGARARVAIARQEVADAVAARAAVQRRVIVARDAGASAAADPALNRANRSRIVAQAAKAQELAEAELTSAIDVETAATQRLTAAQTALATARAQVTRGGTIEQLALETNAKNALTAANARLAEAELALAAAEAAEGAGGAATNRGIAMLSLAERRIAANVELTGSLGVLAAAEANATANVNASRGLAALTVAEERVAANLALAASLDRVAAAEARTAVNATTARGIAALSVAERRIAAEIALAAAETERVAAETALAASTGRLTIAQTAYNATLALGTRAMAGLKGAAATMSAFLGGPLGIALTGAIVGFTYLATRTDEAKEASDRFVAAQKEMADKLGTTTAQLQSQSSAARQLRIDLAEAGLEQARQTRDAVRQNLATRLSLAAARIGVRGGFADAGTLSVASGNLRAGRDSGLTYEQLSDIMRRNPGARASGAGATLSGFFGIDPNQLPQTVQGYAQTGQEVIDAQRRLQAARDEKSKPLPPPPLITGGGRTQAQLEAEAGQIATGVGTLRRAREDYKAAKSKLDVELKEGNITQSEYVTQLGAAKKAVIDAQTAEKARTAGIAAQKKETREAAAAEKKRVREADAAQEAANKRAEQLAGIRAKYDEAPSAIDQADKAKRAIDAMFQDVRGGVTVELTEVKVGDAIFTRADAQAVKDQIDAGVRQPITDAIREQARELEVSRLILAGRSEEADLLRTKYDLIGRVGDVTDDELATLRRNRLAQQDINDAIAARQRLIDNQAQAYASVREAVRNVFAGGSPGDIAKNLMESFRQQFAERLTLKLLGDPEQEYRDRMTRGLNDSANRLSGSAGDLTTAADDMRGASDALIGAADRIGAATGAPAAGGAVSPLLTAIQEKSPTTALDIGSLIESSNAMIANALGDLSEDIVVVASRRGGPRGGGDENMTTEARYNAIGRQFGAKIFGANSPLTRASEKLGTFLSGARYAPAGNAIGQLLGGKGSNLGATIGGGIGKTLLGGSGGLISKGLTAISSKLGSFAGPLGAVAGSVLGSVIGGLFKKTKSGTSTVTSVEGKNAVSGSASYKGVATGLGESVQAGVAKVAEALGGTTGAFKVSIGKYGESYKVNTLGNKIGKNGKAGTVDFDEDQEGAVRFAILDALQDGAVDGIRAGAKRILAAGDDLEAQLDKALRFNNVFRELKAYTDPVGAAVDDVNTEFTKLIDIFNEAGASQAEFADLQKLYDFKRADAIKAATNSALSSIQEFIDGVKGGSDSPFSRRTVYDNAKAKVDTFRDDIAAGRAVDNDQLLEALSALQDASREIYGSRGGFYTDVNDILALAEKAKSNVAASTSAGGALPASPFAPTATTSAAAAGVAPAATFPAGTASDIAQTAGNTAGLVPALTDVGSSIVKAIQGLGGVAVNTGGGRSSLNYLPSRVNER